MNVNFLSTCSDKKSCHTSTTLQTSTRGLSAIAELLVNTVTIVLSPSAQLCCRLANKMKKNTVCKERSLLCLLAVVSLIFTCLGYLTSFCRHAVVRCLSVRLSVCLSFTFMYSVETNEHIFNFFNIG